MRRSILPAVLPCLALLAGCPDQPREPAQAPAGAAAPAAPAPVAPPLRHAEGGVTLTGTVAFTGKAPEMPLLPRGGDPVCARTPMRDESIVVNGNGTLRNVLVRVTSGVTGPYAPPAGPAVLDQRECMYRPRVQVAVAGQPVLVRNSDGTLHNVHALYGPRTLWNRVQPGADSPPIPWTAEMKNDGPGTLVRLRCDVHPWMTAYVYVAEHPFLAVTGEDGSFSLQHLPEGTYTIEAWHERLGVKSAQVTIGKDPPAPLRFTYTGQEPPAAP